MLHLRELVQLSLFLQSRSCSGLSIHLSLSLRPSSVLRCPGIGISRVVFLVEKGA